MAISRFSILTHFAVNNHLENSAIGVADGAVELDDISWYMRVVLDPRLISVQEGPETQGVKHDEGRGRRGMRGRGNIAVTMVT